MAMTKAERQKFEELETRLSLAWPSYAKPARVIIPAEARWDQYTQGWFCNHHTLIVTLGESNRGFHSRDISYSGSRSQGHGVMYKTKLEAMQAMRWEASEEFAKKLRAIDARIEKEMEADAAEKA